MGDKNDGGNSGVLNRPWWPSGLSWQQCSRKLAAEDPGLNPR